MISEQPDPSIGILTIRPTQFNVHWWIYVDVKPRLIHDGPSHGLDAVDLEAQNEARSTHLDHLSQPWESRLQQEYDIKYFRVNAFSRRGKHSFKEIMKEKPGIVNL